VIWCGMRFVYQGFDPLIQYHRKFLLGLVVEILGVIIIVLPLILQHDNITVTTIVELFALSYLCRGVILMIVFRHSLSGIEFDYNPINFLKPAFPFLLLTFMAMLQQRTDLYLVALDLTPENTAAYQVFLNLLLLSHVVASLLLSPYARNLFRLSHKGLRKIERQFMRAGILLSAVSIGVIYIIVQLVFQFQLSVFMYVAGYFYVLLYYFYQVRNYQFMKEHRQGDVALFSFAGCVVSLILGLILIPLYGIEGAILAGLSTQLLNAILHLRVRFQDAKKEIIESSSAVS
jgi:O-antigen/teichoic acid export membrane protein